MIRKTWALGVLAMAMIATGLACAADSDSNQPAPDKNGFVELFNGKNLDGWKIGKNAASFKVEDGHIVINGEGPAHLFYEGPVHNHDWKNFHLRAELMTFPHANSGIYFHTKFQQSGFPDQGFEAQVNATHSDPKKTGSLYDVKDIYDPHHKDNEWFVYDIIVKGNHVVLQINGQTVCDWTQPDHFVPPANHPLRFLQHGTFALQGHDPGSKTWFRSIKVKALD